jgi:SAM-dependent methyltransferase
MYRCSACRTAFVHPQPTARQLEDFYRRFHLHDSEGGCYDAIEGRMQADFPAKVALVRRYSGMDRPRLLDVGCGKGFFLRVCQDAGIDAEGIDLSDSGVLYATGTLGVKARCGDLAALKAELGLFDVATFWATIEHVPDPVGMLRDIASVLKPGGVLLVDTGIGDDWLDRLLPGLNQWYDPPQHLFVFSAPGLQKALASAGFSLIHLDTCFERSGPRRLIRKVRAACVAAGLRAIAAAGRMHGDRFVFTRYPVGNLMSAVARKPAAP